MSANNDANRLVTQLYSKPSPFAPDIEPNRRNLTVKQKHEVFISEMIAHGNRRIAYQEVYPSASDAAARTSACRLLADPEIAQKIHEGRLKAQKLAHEELKKQYNGKLADLEEKRAVLAQIIRGEMVSESVTLDKDGTTQLTTRKTSPKDRINAILLDNKLEEEWKQLLTMPDNGICYLE